MTVVAFISQRFNDRGTLPRSIRAMRAVAVAGIALGVAALVVATSIGRGFESRYRRALLDFNAHVVLMGGGEIAGTREAEAGIDAVRFGSPADAEEARRFGALVPWVERARHVLAGFEAAHRTVALALSEHPRLGDLWQETDPQQLAELLPGAVRRAIVLADRAASRGVIASTPFLYREALGIGGGRITGLVVKGIDPRTMAGVNAMPIRLFAPGITLADALAVRPGEPPAAIAGLAMARGFGIDAAPGSVRLLVPREEHGRASTRRFDEVRIVGTFESGMHDYDAQFLLMDLPAARALFGVPAGTVTGIELKLDDAAKAEAVARGLETTLGPRYSAVTWGELNRELLAAVRLEQLVSGIIMGIMVIVAALNIVAVLVLMTIYRFHEIAILKALGLTHRQVGGLLTRGGTAVGLWGAATGLLFGVGASLALRSFNLIPLEAEIYLIGALPIDISPLVCGMIALFCLGVGYVTSRLAARKLAMVPIAEGLTIAR